MKKLKAMLFAVMVCVPVGAGAQMATVDMPHILVAIENALNAYDSAVKQYDRLTGAYNQLQKLENIASGNADFMDILNSELILDNLPEDLSGAIVAAGSSQEYFQLRKKCPATKNQSYADACDLSARLIVIQHGYQKRAKLREARIQKYKDQYKMADTDAKKQAALQKLQEEQAGINNDYYSINTMSGSLESLINQKRSDGFKTHMCQEFHANADECK